MASSQPYVINSGNRQDIKLTADSIELSDGTTTQAAIESLKAKDTEFVNFKDSIENKYRKENTAYANDDMSYAAELPAGFYLECTTAGTTSTGALVLPATIADGTTFSDGTVGWTIRKVVSTEDIPTVPSLSEYATTNYVDNKVSEYATTSYVDSKVPSLSGYAKLASPSFTGSPTAPTPSTSTDSTRIATTAFVHSLLSSSGDSSGDFTILYPGGSASSPGTITKATKTVLSNPFSGYYVDCQAEVLINGAWSDTGATYAGTDAGTTGVYAGMYGDNIVVATGSNSVFHKTRGTHLFYNDTMISGSYKSLPFRVKVWKVGKK